MPFLLFPVIGGAAMAVAAVAGVVWNRDRRIAAIRAKGLDDDHKAIIERNVALYHKLPEELRTQLLDDVPVFLHEKHFEGCGGLEITDEIRVTIAAQACLLTLKARPRTKHYPRLRTVLVYPGAFVSEEESVRLGESWRHGSVVLSWDEEHRNAIDPLNGTNVVLHEFAHQLDQEDGHSDGAPVLANGAAYAVWAQVLNKQYQELVNETMAGHKTDIDAYGATNPAEFFAVVSETFFTKPKSLCRKHPKLYATLRDYFQVDPATWK